MIVQHDWHVFAPKVGLTLVRLRNQQSQGLISASIMSMPNLMMINWNDKTVDATLTTEDSTYIRSRSLDLQFRFGIKKYMKPNFRGVYVGIGTGLSLSMYRVQITDWSRTTDYSQNEIKTTEVIHGAKRGVVPYLFFSGNLGITRQLKNRPLDIGMRSSLVFQVKNNSIDVSPKSEDDIRNNIVFMGKKALQSQQILEFYVRYSIFP